MLAKLLRPNPAELGPLVEQVRMALIDRALTTGFATGPEAPSDLSSIRRSIGNAYDLWWFSLPWWKAVWLSGSIERRHRLFTAHAGQCGLLDKWTKRVHIGIGAVRLDRDGGS